MATAAEYEQIVGLIQAGNGALAQQMEFIDNSPAAAPVQVASLTPAQAYQQDVQDIMTGSNVDWTQPSTTFGTPGVDLAPVPASTWVDPVPEYAPAPFELQQQPMFSSPDVFGG